MATRQSETKEERARRLLLRHAGTEARRAGRKLSERDVAIRAAAEAGCSLRELAQETGLGHMTVKRILERENAT